MSFKNDSNLKRPVKNLLKVVIESAVKNFACLLCPVIFLLKTCH